LQDNIIQQTTTTKTIVTKPVVNQSNCAGTLVNGVCMISSCIDSDANEKPDDIFIKGKVTHTNKEGVVNIVYDKCNGTNTQVNEM
jgi:hypothetical protein